MKKGFTLLELTVAVGIMSLLFIVAADLFSQGSFLQRKSLERAEILNQISYALEFMSRELRLAQKDLNGSCISAKNNYLVEGTNSIKFKDFNGKCQRFYLLNNQLMHDYQDHYSALPLTSPKIIVSSLKFLVEGQTQDDTLQPRVTLILEIEKPLKAKFQTTVSQRELDVQY